MGMLDKLGSVASGVGHFIKGQAETAGSGLKDIGSGAWGIVHDTIIEPWQEAGTGMSAWDAVKHGLASDVGNIGQMLGGIEKVALAPLGKDNAGDLLELQKDAYQFVDQQIATVELAAQHADSKIEHPDQGYFERMGNIFHKKTWVDAHADVKEHKYTLGQGFVLMFTDDIGDEQEVENFKKGELYTTVAPTLDVVAPFLIPMDPAYLALKAGGAARTSIVAQRTVTAGDDLSQLAASRRIEQVAHGMSDKDAAQIRHEYFPNHPQGAQLSGVLADAKTPAEKSLILRSALGSLDDIDRLGNINALAANRVRRLMGEQDALRAAGEFDLPYNFGAPRTYTPVAPAEIERLQAEIDQLHDLQWRLNRRLGVQGVLEQLPRNTLSNKVRVGVTRSDWYQQPVGAPLRVMFQHRTHHLVELDAPDGDVQVQRLVDHASMPLDQREQFRTAYIQARDAQGRYQVVHEAENTAINSILNKYGYTEADKQKIIALATDGRAATAEILRSRAFDGEGRSTVRLRGEAHPTDIPLMVSQNANVYALTDLDRLEKVARRYAPDRTANRLTKGRYGEKAEQWAEISDGALQSFHRIWKPVTLLRAAYPFRVVGEEQLRIMAQFGALAMKDYYKQGFANRREDTRIINEKTAALRADKEQALDRALTRSELNELRKQVKADYETNERIRGFRSIEYDGYQIEPALGGKGRMYADFVSSKRSFDAQIGTDLALAAERVAKEVKGGVPTGEFRSGIKGDEQSWGNAWVHAVNRQIGSDAAAQKVLRGAGDDEIIAWLHSAEGSKYRRELHGYWRNNPDEWLSNLRGQIDSYLPTQALKDAALNKRASIDLAVREMPDATMRPVVHGEILSQHLTGNAFVRAWNTVVERGYRALASYPTDVLSRNQAFNHIYVREVERRIALRTHAMREKGDRTRIGQDEISRIEQQARQKALHEVKKNLYDLAEESDLSHALRYVSPFFNAWQEVLTVWARRTIEKPQILARAAELWQAPDRAGLTYTDPTNGDTHIMLPIPGWIRDHFPGGVLKEQKYLDVNKRGLNLILTGSPGMGPIMGLAAHEVVKNRPDIASQGIVKLLFPYGVPNSAKQALLPTVIKNTMRANENADGDNYLRNFTSIYLTELTDYRLGKRATRPDLKEIESKAHHMALLQAVTQWFSPVPVQYKSPYQPYIDAYRRLRSSDPEHADQIFYDEFGSEYFGLVQHMTKSVNGVPPTIEGWKQYNKYKTLIDAHPELGSIIVGAGAGQGPFNQAVYQWTKQSSAGPGTGSNMREPLGLADLIAQPDVNTGWIEFNKGMQIVYAEMERRGLNNLQSKQAEDLKATKQALTESLAQKYPAWWTDYNQTDRSKWERKIEGLTAIASSPQFTGRQDIEGLREYLDARAQVIAALGTREAHSLKAKSNADIATAWDAFTDELAAKNPAFSTLYLRYLSNDVLEAA